MAGDKCNVIGRAACEKHRMLYVFIGAILVDIAVVFQDGFAQ